MIEGVALVTSNFGLGKDNDLLVKSKADMQYFKEVTMNKVVVMGRKTFDSIGKPLPNRTNIVLTHDVSFKHDGIIVYHSVDDILNNHKDFIVIGGGEIYKLFKYDKFYLNICNKNIECDVFFDRKILENMKSVVGRRLDDGIQPYIYYHK